MTVNMEFAKTKAKANKRANELRRLSGNYKASVYHDGVSWVIEYWQES